MRFFRSVSVLIPIVLLLGFVVSCSAGEYELTIDGHLLSVEVADTPETRQRGLMERRELDPAAGMLFVFDQSAPRSFWMKNTLIPLSIAYIDENLVIREIHDMEPLSLVPVESRFAAQYALEVNQGVFDSLEIAPGARLRPSRALRERIERLND